MSSRVNDEAISVAVVHAFLAELFSSSSFISVASNVTSTRSRLPLKHVIVIGTILVF